MTQAAWPSERQRGYVETLSTYDPKLYASWHTRLEAAFANKRVDRRSEAVILSGLLSILHFAGPVVERHVNEAFNAGSNVAELLEIMVRAGEQEGAHGQSSGGNALWQVINRRQAAGLPTPLRGAPLTAAELVPHSPWLPARFPYHTPYPRLWRQLVVKYDPARWEIIERSAAEQAKLPRQLSRRMSEVFDAVVDAVICYPAPFFDHHVHEALNAGSNVQELLELMIVCAEAAQGARDSNIAGRQVESGARIIHHGLRGLDRVIGEREGAGVLTPHDYGSVPKAGS